MASAKVLVVDDEPFNARLLGLKLAPAGYEVLRAANGLQGLEKVRAERPSVVVVDVMMPVMNGRQFCEQAEAIKREQPFLTIVVTSAADREHRRWAAELTETIFMEKPISPRALLETVEAYCGGGTGE